MQNTRTTFLDSVWCQDILYRTWTWKVLGLSYWSWLMMNKMMNCFCGMVGRQKAFSFNSSRDHCQRSSPSQISSSRVWTCAEPEFRLTWMKLSSGDNHYSTAHKKNILTALLGSDWFYCTLDLDWLNELTKQRWH